MVASRPTLSGSGSTYKYSNYFIGKSNWNSGFISYSHHSFANKYSDYFVQTSYQRSTPQICFTTSVLSKYSVIPEKYISVIGSYYAASTSHHYLFSKISEKYISVVAASTSQHYSLSNTPNQYISIVGSVSVTQYSVLLSLSTPATTPTVAPTFMPTVTTTFMPTPATTFEPTFMPTVTTTFMPTPATTFEPTFMPTPATTFEPTFIPTSTTTFEPTFMPTFEPTFIPTSTTTFEPTFMPIPESNPTITFLTTATLSGFPTSSLSIPEQTAYIIAFSTSININSQMVEIVNQQLANRRLTYNIDITTQITYPYVLDPQSTYVLLANKIQTNIGVGSNFTKLLISVSKQMGITSYNNVSVIGVYVSPLLKGDDVKPTPPYKIGTALLVIMILPAVSVVLIFVVYLYKKHYRRRYNIIENPLSSRV